MYGYESTDDHQPVTWLRGQPIYAAHFVVLVFVVSMLATTLLQFANADVVLNWMPFYSAAVFNGQLWRVLSYGFINPPSLGFVIEMALIVWFGREIERFFGRRSFFILYGGLYLLSPLLLIAIGRWHPSQLAGESAGFALFVAFATLYPNAAVFFNLLAKWVAVILVGIYSLIALSRHDFDGLLSLWAAVGFAYAFVRHEQGHFAFPQMNFFKRKPNLRVLPDLVSEKTTSTQTRKDDAMAEVDALLDKIARSGMGSLTSKERAKLESARDDLRKRDRARR